MNHLLVDTGPLVAILDADDVDHGRCVRVLEEVRAQLVTTWPAVTESMYLLGSSLEAQRALLGMLRAGDLVVADVLSLLGRIEQLMEKYRDTPMDFADGSLVAVAEENGWDTVFTLDDDFHVYRLHGRRAFRVLPAA